jgi:hypothetical protein
MLAVCSAIGSAQDSRAMDNWSASMADTAAQLQEQCMATELALARVANAVKRSMPVTATLTTPMVAAAVNATALVNLLQAGLLRYPGDASRSTADGLLCGPSSDAAVVQNTLGVVANATTPLLSLYQRAASLGPAGADVANALGVVLGVEGRVEWARAGDVARTTLEEEDAATRAGSTPAAVCVVS